jgi:hypothetical protein
VPQLGHCSFFSPFRKSRNPIAIPQSAESTQEDGRQNELPL